MPYAKSVKADNKNTSLLTATALSSLKFWNVRPKHLQERKTIHILNS